MGPPTKQRLLHWPSNEGPLRDQPPTRVRWCNVPKPTLEAGRCSAEGASCKGRTAPCRNCRFLHCEPHAVHFEGLTVPPDAWKGLYIKLARNIEQSAGIARAKLHVDEDRNAAMLDYRLKGRVVDVNPPVRIEFCDVPSSGRVDSACGHQSKPCTGSIRACEWCLFTYCERHIVFHVRRLAVPPALWEIAVRRLRAAMESVIKREQRLVWVRLPRTNHMTPPEE